MLTVISHKLSSLPNSISEILTPWLLEHCQTDNSRKSYLSDLSHFIRFINSHDIKFQEIRKSTILLYLEKLSDEGLAASTRSKKLTVLKSAVRALYLKNYFPAEETEQILSICGPRVSKDGRTPGLSCSEVTKMLNTPDKSTLQGYRDFTILMVLFYTGARVSALTQLRVRDFTYETSLLQLHEKGGRKLIIPVNGKTAAAITSWIKRAKLSRENILFPPFYKRSRSDLIDKVMHPSSLWYLIKRVAKKAEIETDRFNARGICVHSTRVTAITRAFQGGAKLEEVQEMAGHLDPRNTIRYRKSAKGDIKRAVMSITY